MKRWNPPILSREKVEEMVNAAHKGGGRANLYGAILTRRNLSGMDLHDTNLINVNLREANLSGANLSGTKLSYADLSRANLMGANLTGADLSEAKLNGTKYSSETKWPEGYTTPPGAVLLTDGGADEGTLKDSLCVLCLKPDPDTIEDMTTEEVSSRYSGHHKMTTETTTYTYPALPFHKKCQEKFTRENWIVFPIVAAAGWWILGIIIMGGFESIQLNCAVGMIILALPLGFWVIRQIGLEHTRFESKLKKWEIVSYGNVSTSIDSSKG